MIIGSGKKIRKKKERKQRAIDKRHKLVRSRVSFPI